MSHFCMWAITKTDSEEELEKVMQPYHEYECTGTDDEYVIHVDETEELLEDYKQYYKPEEDGLLKEWINGWNSCKNFFTVIESEKVSFDQIKDSYCIISNDGTQIVKYCNYTNPNAKWDWWVIGGRWDQDKNCLRKSEFDYDDWYKKEKAYFTDTYRRIKSLIDYKTLIRWKDVKDLPRESVEVNAYYNQPTKEAINKADLWGINWEEILDTTEEEYLEKKMSNTSPCFGYVTEDGWFEKANMGWFACTSNEKPNWGEHFKKYWDSLPDDAVIWNIDCHI